MADRRVLRQQMAVVGLRFVVGLSVAVWGFHIAHAPNTIVGAFAQEWNVDFLPSIAVLVGWFLVPAGIAIIVGFWLYLVSGIVLLLYTVTIIPVFSMLPDPNAAKLVATQMPLPILTMIVLILLLPEDAP